MDNDAKIQKYCDSGKMCQYVMYMEQFWAFSADPILDDDHKKIMKAIYEHYHRMTLCMAMKELLPEYGFEKVIDVDYMKNMYRKYIEE